MNCQKKIQEKIEENNQTIKKSKSELETKKANSNKHRKEVQESSKIRETLTNEKEILEERRIQKEKELKNLGVLPVNEIEALKNQNIKELTRQLGAIKIDLEKRKKINSNATDQYVESSNRREILQQRKDEIDKSLEKIEVLMNTLEQEREKKIDYTVKQAGFHFKEIFKLLTDNEGEGKLVLKYPKLSKTTSKTASGLDMVVTFKQGEKPTPINSLSGGQKTICALALIFAIQKCDRAPFYLFDEIDANLDSAKRKNLAKVIREFSKAEQVNENESIQYIIATFHKEIVEKSHKAFHITNDGTSHIVPIPIREAELIILQETKKTIAQQAPTSKAEEEDVVEQNKENLTTHNVEERPSKSTDVSDSERSKGKKQTKKKQPKKRGSKQRKSTDDESLSSRKDSDEVSKANLDLTFLDE